MPIAEGISNFDVGCGTASALQTAVFGARISYLKIDSVYDDIALSSHRIHGINGGCRRGKTLDSLVHLDTVVTVVDTPNFLENYNSQQNISERPDLDNTGTSNTPVVSLLVEQVEFANVIVLNKKSEVTQEDLDSAKSIVAGLNPGAKVITVYRSGGHVMYTVVVCCVLM
jgi:G3E family GTPase